LLGVAALASLCLSASGSAATRVDGLTINVTYATSSLQATLSNGTALNSGTVVPPGPYSVVVYDSADMNPQFTMSGPDASVSSDLSPSGMGIEVPVTFGPFVLQPSASYTISDADWGQGSSIAFTTSATGSSASSSPTTTTSSGEGSTSSSGSSASPGGTTSGSPGAKTLGTLAFSVGANGKPLLTIGAKPVKTLRAGHYSLVTGDSSKTAGLFIGHGTAHLSELSGVAAVGTSLRTLSLTAGKWFFEGSPKGPKIYFTVS
jgi:hypothetical protein